MNICECDNSLNSKRSWDSRCSTSKTYTGRSHFIARLFLCFTDFFLYVNWRQDPPPAKIMTGIIAILALLWWLGTEIQYLQGTPVLLWVGSTLHKQESSGSPLAHLLNATASKETQWKPAINQLWAQELSFLTASSVLTLTGLTHSHLASVLGSGYLEAQPEKGFGYRRKGLRAGEVGAEQECGLSWSGFIVIPGEAAEYEL